MNQQAMLRQIKKMQQEMLETQREIEETEFNANVGPVSMTMLGNKTVIKVKIDADYKLDSTDDTEMLEDSIQAAQNQLISEIDKFTEEKMGKYRQFLGGF